MNNDLLRLASLAKGRVRRVGAAHGRRVECLSGALWITQDGDLRDIVLSRGRGVRLRPQRRRADQRLQRLALPALDGCAAARVTEPGP